MLSALIFQNWIRSKSFVTFSAWRSGFDDKPVLSHPTETMCQVLLYIKDVLPSQQYHEMPY